MSLRVIDGKEVTEVTTAPIAKLGERRVDTDGREYRYGQVVDSDVAVSAGSVVGMNDASDLGSGVSADLSDSAANLVYGVALATVANGSYAWFQTRGYYATVKTNGDDDIAAGDTLIWGADGVVNSVAAGTASTYRPVGYAAAADVDANNTVAADLCI